MYWKWLHPDTDAVSEMCVCVCVLQFNFVGRILGPRGLTAKQLEAETGCKIMVRGKGSMRDKKKVRSTDTHTYTNIHQHTRTHIHTDWECHYSLNMICNHIFFFCQINLNNLFNSDNIIF